KGRLVSAFGYCFLEAPSQFWPLLSSVPFIYMRLFRATLRRSAEINALPAKTRGPAKFSATAFINMASRWIAAWQFLIRQRLFANLVGSSCLTGQRFINDLKQIVVLGNPEV